MYITKHHPCRTAKDVLVCCIAIRVAVSPGASPFALAAGVSQGQGGGSRRRVSAAQRNVQAFQVVLEPPLPLVRYAIAAYEATGCNR